MKYMIVKTAVHTGLIKSVEAYRNNAVAQMNALNDTLEENARLKEEVRMLQKANEQARRITAQIEHSRQILNEKYKSVMEELNAIRDHTEAISEDSQT